MIQFSRESKGVDSRIFIWMHLRARLGGGVIV